MDVGKICHQELLHRHNLLFGVVTYASGRLGEEPIRSQGHVHKISPHCNSSTAEIFEIWTGRAIIYMQERVADDPGRCFAILAKEGDIVVVPPAWAHFAISANPIFPLTFAAFCVRDYGFEYSEIRKRRGLAWHPVLNGQDILWRPNALYRSRGLVSSNARAYPELGLTGRQPIYKEFERSPDSLRWVGDPRLGPDIWHDCVP
jgi:glucose-6-phosphate isomerase